MVHRLVGFRGTGSHPLRVALAQGDASAAVKDGYYASDDPQKLWEDFSYFQRIGIDYLLLDDTNNHLADNGNIARHIDACFKTAEEMGRAPRMCLGGGSPLLNNDEPGMVAELNAFYRYAERYPDHFYFLDGKPLCVNFNLPDRYAWQDPHGRFTMRPAAGTPPRGRDARRRNCWIGWACTAGCSIANTIARGFTASIPAGPAATTGCPAVRRRCPAGRANITAGSGWRPLSASRRPSSSPAGTITRRKPASRR